jgi:hypothetical protein
MKTAFRQPEIAYIMRHPASLSARKLDPGLRRGDAQAGGYAGGGGSPTTLTPP